MSLRTSSLLNFVLTAIAIAVAVVLAQQPARAAVYGYYAMQTALLAAWVLYLTADWRHRGAALGRYGWLVQAAVISVLFYLLSSFMFPLKLVTEQTYLKELGPLGSGTDPSALGMFDAMAPLVAAIIALGYPIAGRMFQLLGPMVAATIIVVQLVRLLLALLPSHPGERALSVVARRTELPGIALLTVLGFVALGFVPGFPQRGIVEGLTGWHLMLLYFGYWLLHDAWRLWQTWRTPPQPSARSAQRE